MDLKAKGTLSVVELNKGEACTFTLRNGEQRTLVLEDTDAQAIFTNLSELSTIRPGSVTLYLFTCTVTIDGHPMKMERYVGSQESLYEPYVVNGMRIWFDGVSCIFSNGVVNEEHGKCCPGKDARFALSDMTEDICPFKVQGLYANGENWIDVEQSYNGDDVWMGPYHGAEAHGGLDINMPRCTPNYAPFPIDDHCLVTSLVGGSNNNRWRGEHTWDNGDVWYLQNAHIHGLRVPEHEPIPAGTHYVDAAGVWSGTHDHAHYIFMVKQPGDKEMLRVDPWILFWQSFENAKRDHGELRAMIAPLSPAKTGTAVQYNSRGSAAGGPNRRLSYCWTFGDGGWSDEQNPEHTYTRPGIYPVTLVVDDGARKATSTQHMTVDGGETTEPALVLSADDEPSFRLRPMHMMDTYGEAPTTYPHSLHFVGRQSRPVPRPAVVHLHNDGAGTLAKANGPVVEYHRGMGWLSMRHAGTGNDQRLDVSVNSDTLPAGVYSATVHVAVPGALNGTQGFVVELTVPACPTRHSSMRNYGQDIVHNLDHRPGRFYATPYFWVRPKFQRLEERGYNRQYFMTNGGRPRGGEFARFTPDLEAGKYEVTFAEETPFEPERRAMSPKGPQSVNPSLNPNSRFMVRVRSRDDDQRLWVEPHRSRAIGVFEFDEGMDGFVEILAEGSTGQVLVDAVVFRKVD